MAGDGVCHACDSPRGRFFALDPGLIVRAPAEVRPRIRVDHAQLRRQFSNIAVGTTRDSSTGGPRESMLHQAEVGLHVAMTNDEPLGDEQLNVSVPLQPTWDASLTYDLLEGDPDSLPRGIFVGREGLVDPLVHAISQPQQRGTYLISGFRGVGKTTLLIEGMHRARADLRSADWELLPIVLNVSEVSASLSSATDTEPVELGISARKLLTALLRALHQRLSQNATPSLSRVAGKVGSAYLKAASTRFTETQTQKTEAAVTVSEERTRSFHISDGMKLLGALFLLGAAFTETTVWLGAFNQLHAVAIACAGLAVWSFGSSRMVKRTGSNTGVDAMELIIDNSLHQLESELKDILEDLSRAKQRTVIVLEELDKIDDESGDQLESIIRYFKNLFTQAPALFFFVTDKAYYDAVGDRIDAARARGSYAVEHTFFTHRIFVVRPGIEECLDYLCRIFTSEPAIADVVAIARSSADRSRPLVEMSSLERCLRVLLFRSQDHFFDLKNQLRRFVQVDGKEATLRFDSSVVPQNEEALAAFQFLVEQKIHTYHFGGGRDYANEALRSCLFAVFDQFGTQIPREVETLYPAEGYIGERLSLSERSRIIDAIDTLVEDLERGKSLERHFDERWKFIWSKSDPALVFAPVVRLQPHEEALVSELSRMGATAGSWAGAEGLRGLLDGQSRFESSLKLGEDLSSQANVIANSQKAMPSEEAEIHRVVAEKRMGDMFGPLVADHVSRIRASSSLFLEPLSRSTPPILYRVRSAEESDRGIVFLHYEMFGSSLSHIPQIEAGKFEKVAVVQVAVDITGPPRKDQFGDLPMVSLAGIGAQEYHIVQTRLDEQIEPNEAGLWGQRTLDELHLALLWIAGPVQAKLPRQVEAQLPRAVVLLTSETDPRTMTLSEAVGVWLEDGDQNLVVARGLTPSPDALFAAVNEHGFVILNGEGDNDRSGFLAEESVDRLIASGRVISAQAVLPWDLEGWLSSKVGSRGTRSIAIVDLQGFLPAPLDTLRAPYSVIHSVEVGPQRVQFERTVLANYPEHGISVLRGGAEAGETEAMAELAVILAPRERHESRAWQAKLVEAGSATDLVETGDDLRELDPEGAIALYQAAAQKGSPSAMGSLVAMLATNNPEESLRWQAKLIEMGAASELERAGARVRKGDIDRAVALYEAAAQAGSRSAMATLVEILATHNPEESLRWQAKIVEMGSVIELERAGERVRSSDTDGAVALYEAAAKAGSRSAMATLVEMLATLSPEESLRWQAKLVELSDGLWLEEAGRRLRPRNPERAKSLFEAATAAGSSTAQAELERMLGVRGAEN